MFDELLRKELLLREEVSSTRKPRILIAEIRPSKNSWLQKQLNEFDLTITHSGWGALELALVAWQSGKPFDLIFIDEDLPHLSGREFVNYLRSKQYEGLVVGVSADASSGTNYDHTIMGYDGVVRNDSPSEEIERVLSLFLDRATSAVNKLCGSNLKSNIVNHRLDDRTEDNTGE